MGDFKEPTALLEKSRQILDALITRIPADEEPLCGNAAVYAIITTTLGINSDNFMFICVMRVQLLCSCASMLVSMVIRM